MKRLFKNDGATTHSIMFHHFHNDVHPIGQGSISGHQFKQVIDWLDEKYNLLSADEYQNRFLQKQMWSKFKKTHGLELNNNHEHNGMGSQGLEFKTKNKIMSL